MSSALGRALVTVPTFWIWHLLFLPEQGDLSEPVVKFTCFQAIRRVLLVLGRGVIRHPVFSTNESNNFALFAFLLGHPDLRFASHRFWHETASSRKPITPPPTNFGKNEVVLSVCIVAKMCPSATFRRRSGKKRHLVRRTLLS